MGNRLLVKDNADLVAVFKSARQILQVETREGEARAVKTGFGTDRISDLERFGSFALRPHFGIHGFLRADACTREEVIGLLLSAEVEAVVNLKNPGYDVLFYLRREAEEPQMIEIQVSVLAVGELPEEYRYLKRQVAELEGLGGRVESWPQREHLYMEARRWQEEDLRGMLEILLGGLPGPGHVHASLTGSLDWIRKLEVEEKVVPCRSCCASHLSFGYPYPSPSDTQIELLGEVADFLLLRTGERYVSFSGFTWSWESVEIPPSNSNMILWRVGKKSRASLEIFWHEPVPRGVLPRLQKDIERALGGGSA